MAGRPVIPSRSDLGSAYNALSSLLKNSKFNKQNFGPNDSIIASSLAHPYNALVHGTDWFKNQVNTVAGIPINDESSIYSYGPSSGQQINAGINLAGLAQLGAMPSAPKSSGGTLGMVIKSALPPTKFSKAHDVAQRNAALPVDQGGLGLHPQNTAMDRAEALGYDIENPLYHGTGNDIKKFQNSKRGINTGDITPASNIAHWTTNDPNYANDYALYGANTQGGNANIMPLYSRTNSPYDTTEIDLRDLLMERGGKSNLKNNMANFGQDSIEISDPHELGVLNPKNIRSRFAAFDPMQKNSINILASILAGTTLASQYRDKRR